MSAPAELIPSSSPDDQPPTATSPGAVLSADPPAEHTQPAASVAARPTIAISLLTAHPGNVRRDLDLSADFVASIAANGVLVPLRITPADGGYRVIDGHRRLAAAVKAGLAEVPADLADDRAGDEPGQYLDMWTSHRHRNPLTPIEEADALFAAHEAGATKARIRKSTGLKNPQVSAALSAARLSTDTRATVEALSCEMTLEDLAVFAEFDGDPAAITRLTDIARWGGSLEHQAELLRQECAERAEHERLRHDLENAGTAVTDTLPPRAQLLTILRHDGEPLTSEAHADCPGRGAFFRSYDLTTPVHYCADPDAHGHSLRDSNRGPSGVTAGAAGTGGPTGTAGPAGPSDPDRPDGTRRLVIEGNKAWKAAAEVRKRWLASHLFARRTAPREIAPFIARQLLTMPDPLRQGLSPAHSRLLFSELTGQSAARWLEACDTTPAGRLPLLMLGPIAVAYEQAMTEGEGKNTWRPDRYSPCPRLEAGRYLALLASIGYELSDIEQAVAGGMPYTGDTPPGDPLAADDAQVREPESGDQHAPDSEGVTDDADPATPDSRQEDTGSGAEQAAA
jgi:ParB family transcriptional regulator, chromosome partitioning protein